MFDPDEKTLRDLMAEMKAEYDERIKQLEIAAGLRFADPHELDDVGMQKDSVREEYEAFDSQFRGN